MFKLLNTSLQDCFEIINKNNSDNRGKFVKIFHEPEFNKLGIEVDFKEDYYSISKKNVIRGLHFQLPNMEHNKLVFCLHGHVLDVVVDLRVGSPTFGKCHTAELKYDNFKSIYIPKGFAHGFRALSNECIVVYKVSTIYSPYHDSGIFWNSVDVDWQIKNPIISERDLNFVKFNNFKSPFIYKNKIT
jgi:dTDP-4-dehydrorhamnose 3,5-epimerase